MIKLKDILLESKKELLEGISKNIEVHYDELFEEAKNALKKEQERECRSLLERIDVLKKVLVQETGENSNIKSDLKKISDNFDKIIGELTDLRSTKIKSMDISI